MRQVISISFPDREVKEIKKTAKKRGFSSVSAYFKRLFTDDTADIISREELLKTVARSRKEYKNGDVVYAPSIRDLL